MRLWVKPDQLAKLGITVPEIISAIQTQNTVNPAGQVGSEPIPSGQPFTYSVRAQGRLISPEEFGDIVVRETPDERNRARARRRAGRAGIAGLQRGPDTSTASRARLSRSTSCRDRTRSIPPPASES